LGAAAVISLLVLPFIFLNDLGAHNTAGEVTEIVFYFALGGLIGGIVSREFKIRRRQQETELALERSQRQAMVGQMASSVAHEIKNPIASVKGAVEILCDKDIPEREREEFREIVVSEIKRIDGTLRDFLEFGRPREPRFEPMNLSETVAAGVRQIEGHAAQACVRLVRRIAPEVSIDGDREKIHQVMLNLLLNALEASSDGGVMTVTVERMGDAARILVEDQGCGIARGEMERIFDPFYSTKSTGSGLGLAVAKQIVESHGGEISVSSELGAGTTFAIVLPRGGGV
jgi:signal transduction histidine kinase